MGSASARPAALIVSSNWHLAPAKRRAKCEPPSWMTDAADPQDAEPLHRLADATQLDKQVGLLTMQW